MVYLTSRAQGNVEYVNASQVQAAKDEQSRAALPQRWVIAGLLQLAICSPAVVNAGERSVTGVRHATGVVMMVGGMTTSETTVAPVVRPASIALQRPEQPIHSLDDAKPLSVVFQPGVEPSRLSVPGGPSSVRSRIMALSPLINQAAREANVDSALLMAVIDVESGGNPQAVSPKGATGLMQLMPDTGTRHGASDLFDPLQNIGAGARYLKQLMNRFGDLQIALAAYNAGEGAVQKYGGQIPPFKETRNYVPRVIEHYFRYQNAIARSGRAQEDSASSGVIGRLVEVR